MGTINRETNINIREEDLCSDRIWREDHRIRAYETDLHGSLSIPSILNYLQEAAANHAHALGVSTYQIMPQNYTWVLSRLALRMDSHPRWGDPIHVYTWHSGFRGPFALRDFIVTGRDHQCIGAAVSAWLVIDVKTRSPLRRVPSVLDKLKPADIEHPVDNALGKLQRSEGHDQEETFSVRYGDLDLNRHVNNVNYIGWIVSSLSPEILNTFVLMELEINYISEAFAGDEILARYSKTDESPLSLFHVLIRKSDKRELLRAKTAWRYREQAGPLKSRN